MRSLQILKGRGDSTMEMISLFIMEGIIGTTKKFSQVSKSPVITLLQVVSLIDKLNGII
jgi:hypothetical protein